MIQPIIGAPASGRPVRADRRRAALAGGAGGEARDDPGDGPRGGRGPAAADRADRERGPRGPEPGGGGPRLRDPDRRARGFQGGARPPARTQPPGDLQSDPDPRPAGGGARAAAGRCDLSEGHGRAILLASGEEPGAPSRVPQRAPGWSVRETERRAKDGAPRKPKAKVELHPDEEASLAEAEEALENALGHGVQDPQAPQRRPRRAALRRRLPSSRRSPSAPPASGLGPQPLDPPAPPSRRVGEAVVEPPDLALPELDARPARAEPAPVRRAARRDRAETRRGLLEAPVELVARARSTCD